MRFARFLSNIDHKFVLKYTQGSPILCDHSFEGIIHLSYRSVKYTLPRLFREGKYDEAFHLILKESGKNTTFRSVRKWDNHKKIRFVKWIQDQYQKIEAMERDHLSRPPKSKLIRAGIRKLDILGDQPLIDNLAQGDILRWEKIKDLPYEMIFNKQLQLVIQSDIDEELDRIRKEESRLQSKRKR